jgi:hypothetical protein
MGLSLRNTPVKRKLTLLILLTTSFALIFMGSALITYEVVTFRRSLAANMSVLAQIVGSNTTAALAFEDPKNAQEILSALSAERQITAAAIYDDNGKVFARFPVTADSAAIPPAPRRDGYVFRGAALDMFHSISQPEGGRLGTIFLRADLGAMYSVVRRYLFVPRCLNAGLDVAAGSVGTHSGAGKSGSSSVRAAGLFRSRKQIRRGRDWKTH